ncbi:MAG: sulfatase-like hydrolase/transferase [Planctomycetaceae bacterium]|nr:sulfatase-like hydrolase/transferase [Planctomycetaceae bacterium]
MSLSGVAFGADSQSRPNVVFMIADDLGWGDVSFHGGTAPTPHLTKLASEGVELTQHYVAPVCSPTRSALLTGRYWSRFGVTAPQNNRALPWDTVTLPSALRSVGYDTAITGKWHLGSKPEWGPNHFGFDHSYGSLAGGVSPWNHFYKQGPFVETWHRNEKLITETGHVTDLIAREATEWIASRGEKPFFLYVPFTAVHLPIKEPEEWLTRVPAEITGDVPRHYAACVMHLDDAVGRIVAALEKAGKRDNTLLVFTSDNGGSWVENNDLKYPDDHCPNGKLVGNNKPWRGQKGDLYEGGIHVATLANWPARLKPGKLESPAHIADWTPTFCSLAGYSATTDLKWDGRSLAAALVERSPLPSRSLYWTAPGFRARAVRVDDWKLIATGEAKQRKVELFNLARDPGEQQELSQQEPARVAELLRTLEQIAERDRDAVAKD